MFIIFVKMVVNDFSSLDDELDARPNELSALYKHLWTRMLGTQAKKGYQLLAMVLKWAKRRSERPLLVAINMEDRARDRHFASGTTSTNDPQILGSTHVEKASRNNTDRMVKARRLVHGWCKGLLEVRSYAPCAPLRKDHYFVTFTHRSAVEFLQ
jgi:hypothetical protein